MKNQDVKQTHPADKSQENKDKLIRCILSAYKELSRDDQEKVRETVVALYSRRNHE